MRNYIILLSLFIIYSCSSFTEKVISHSSNYESKPAWADITKPMFKKEGKVYSVGVAEASINAKATALARVADNNARHEISRTIVNEMSFIFQNAEEGVENSGELARFYGNEFSKHISSGIYQEERYWEKVKTFDEDGAPKYVLKIYSLISLKESKLKKAMKYALNHEKGLSKEFKAAVDNHLQGQITKLGQE